MKHYGQAWRVIGMPLPAGVQRHRLRRRGRRLFSGNERLYGWPLDPGPIGPLVRR